MEITPAYMEKPKRKSKETNSRLNSILTYLGVKPTLIEFTVDASLETCMSRLTSTAQIQTYFGYLLNRVAVEVKLYQTDDGHCRFSLRKYQRRGPEVEIIGHLEQLSTEKTLMTGSVEMQGFLTEIMLATVAIILGVLFLFSLLLSSAFPF